MLEVETSVYSAEIYDVLLRTNSILLANGFFLSSILGLLLILCFVQPWK